MIDYKQYANSLFGLNLNYPDYWNLLSAQEVYEQLDNIKTNDALFDRNLAENAKEPLIALARYGSDYHDINPTFKISINLYGNLKIKSLDEILIFMFEKFKQIFRNFRVRVAPKEVKSGNHIAFYGMAYYSLESNLDIEYNICSEIWLINRGNYFLMIAASTKHNDDSNARNDIKQIIDSMKIAE